jgi:general nucleoside transport system permease protein
VIPGRCRATRWTLAANVLAAILLVVGTQALARGSVPWSAAAWSAPWSGDVVLVTAGLLFLGLGFLSPLHAGLLNLGVLAQFLAGFAIAASLARAEALHPAARAGLALLAGSGAGLLVGAAMTWLKQRYAVHEVMSGLLLASALAPLARALSIAPTTPPALTFEISIFVAPLRWAPALGLPRHFVLAWGILILSLALALGVFLAQMLRSSVRGFELRTVGSNPLAAFAAGVDVDRVQMAMMMVGGACAGVAGALQLWTQPAVALERWPVPLAFAGLTIAFYGLGSIRGLVLAAVLFAGWLNAPGTLAVLGAPVWGVATAVLLVLPALWILPRLLPDQGSPRSIWRTRHRDPF